MKILKSGNLSKLIGKKIDYRKKKVKVEKLVSKKIMLDSIKEIAKNFMSSGIKIFLVKMALLPEEKMKEEAAFKNGFHPIIVNQIGNIELIQFALIGASIEFYATEKTPINSLSVALVGIKSIIGYNPYLSSMIHEEFYDSQQMLEITEIAETNDLVELIDEISEISGKMKFIGYSKLINYRYLLDALYYDSEDNLDVEFITLIHRNEMFNKKKSNDLLFHNKSFNKYTVIQAMSNIRELSVFSRKEDYVLFLEKYFPKQLKQINIKLLFDIYFDYLNN